MAFGNGYCSDFCTDWYSTTHGISVINNGTDFTIGYTENSFSEYGTEYLIDYGI